MNKTCPICGELPKKNLRIHIFKHSEVSIERRIIYIESLIDSSSKRRKKKRLRKQSDKHRKITHGSKKTKSKSVYWGSVVKTAFESNRRKF